MSISPQQPNSDMLVQQLLDNSVDCIKILTLDGRLHAMNQYGLCLMEIDDFCNVEGGEWVSFWPGVGHGYAIAALQLAQQGNVGRFQGECPTAKGTLKWWDVVVTAVPDIDGKPQWLLAVSRDISELKRAEQAREQALQTAETAIKERDAFMAIAAHELKNPLTALLGQTQLLRRRLVKADQQLDRHVQTLDIILAQANRINSLVGQLFDISRFDQEALELNFSSIDLNHLVQHVVEEFRLDQQKHALLLSIAPEPSLILGDKLRLEQVLFNLIGNAIKYSPNGGQIQLTIENQPTTVNLVITDQGIGIPASALDSIFDRFYRAKNVETATHGGGLGLFVVSEIIKRHNGTIQVESTEGQGSMFKVMLPRQ